MSTHLGNICSNLGMGQRALAPPPLIGEGAANQVGDRQSPGQPAARPSALGTVGAVGYLALAGWLFTHGAAADVVRHGTVPEALRGTGARGDGGCDHSASSTVVLSERTYSSAGKNCTVNGVFETPGRDGTIYAFRLRCPKGPDGRGQSTPANLILTQQGTTTLMGADFSKLKPLLRCAAK